MKGSKRAAPLPPATISEIGRRALPAPGHALGAGRDALDKPLAIELEYVQRMMAWLLLRPAGELARGHAVQLGLGAARDHALHAARR